MICLSICHYSCCPCNYCSNLKWCSWETTFCRWDVTGAHHTVNVLYLTQITIWSEDQAFNLNVMSIFMYLISSLSLQFYCIQAFCGRIYTQNSSDNKKVVGFQFFQCCEEKPEIFMGNAVDLIKWKNCSEQNRYEAILNTSYEVFQVNHRSNRLWLWESILRFHDWVWPLIVAWILNPNVKFCVRLVEIWV